MATETIRTLTKTEAMVVIALAEKRQRLLDAIQEVAGAMSELAKLYAGEDGQFDFEQRGQEIVLTRLTDEAPNAT